MRTVGIICGVGFVESHLPELYLNKGFKVKISVIDIKKSDTYQHLFNLKNSDNLNICEWNTENMERFREFVSECELIILGGVALQVIL